MKRLLCLLALLTLGACASSANAWPHRHTVVSAGACAQGSAYADGCLGANQNAMYQNAGWYSDPTVMAPNNTTHAFIGAANNVAHPWPWNAAGFDYPVGYDKKYGSAIGGAVTTVWLNPFTSQPAGCNAPAKPRLGGSYTMRCFNNFTVEGYDFSNTSGHACVSIEYNPSAGTTAYIRNNNFGENDPYTAGALPAGCLNSVAGVIGTNNCTAATGSNLYITNNTFDGFMNPAATNPTYEAQVVASQATFIGIGCTGDRTTVQYNLFRNGPARVVTNSGTSNGSSGTTFEYNLVLGMNVGNMNGCTLSSYADGTGAAGTFYVTSMGTCSTAPLKIGENISASGTCAIPILSGSNPPAAYTTISQVISAWNGTTGTYIGNNQTTWNSAATPGTGCVQSQPLHGEIGFEGAHTDNEFNTMVWTTDSYENTTFNECLTGQHATYLFDCIDKNNVMIDNLNNLPSSNGPVSTEIIEFGNSPYNIVDVEQNYIDTYGLVTNECGSIYGGGFGNYSGVISDNGTADSVAGNVFGVTTAGTTVYYGGTGTVNSGSFPSGATAPTISGGGITGHPSVLSYSGSTPGGLGNYTLSGPAYYATVTNASNANNTSELPPIASYTWANNTSMNTGATVLPGYNSGTANCN